MRYKQCLCRIWGEARYFNDMSIKARIFQNVIRSISSPDSGQSYISSQASSLLNVLPTDAAIWYSNVADLLVGNSGIKFKMAKWSSFPLFSCPVARPQIYRRKQCAGSVTSNWLKINSLCFVTNSISFVSAPQYYTRAVLAKTILSKSRPFFILRQN